MEEDLNPPMPPMSRIVRRCARLACAAVCAAAAAAAEGLGGTIDVVLDNDLVADSDDGYTGGFHLGYVSRHRASFADGPVPSAIGHALDRLPRLGQPGRRRVIAYGLAQRIFTPEDLESEELVEDDLPYAGLLVASAVAAARDPRHLDALTISVGVVGPSSLAERVQRVAHRVTGSDEARGWRHQLHDEPLLNAQFEHRWRAAAWRGAGLNGDFIVSGSGAAGNIVTMAGGGVNARWGWSVPQDFFVPPPLFGEETVGSMPWDPAEAGRSALYLAASVDASLLANAIHLDGNTFRDSHHVDHDHWTARAHLGLHARIDRASIAVTLVHARIPWDRPNGERWETYVRVSLGWDL